MFRILDSFGTEPVFNVDPTLTESLVKTKSQWGHLNLLPSQYLTLYRKFMYTMNKYLIHTDLLVESKNTSEPFKPSSPNYSAVS